MSPTFWIWILGCLNGISIGWWSASSNPRELKVLGLCVWAFTLFMFITKFAVI
jgi:hypothetical protein